MTRRRRDGSLGGVTSLVSEHRENIERAAQVTELDQRLASQQFQRAPQLVRLSAELAAQPASAHCDNAEYGHRRALHNAEGLVAEEKR